MGASLISRLATRIEQFLTGVRHNTTSAEVCQSYIDSFDRAKSSVYVITGEIEADVFANPGVVGAIREAVTRDDHSVTVAIITGPHPHADSVKALIEFVPEPNFILLQTDTWPDKHPLVVDERHVRLPEPHSPTLPYSGRDHRAELLDNRPRFARRVARDFHRWARDASVPSVEDWETYVADSTVEGALVSDA